MKRLDLTELQDNLTRFYKLKLKEAIREKFPTEKEIEIPSVSFDHFSKTYKTARFTVGFFTVNQIKYEVISPEIYSFSVDWLRSLNSYQDVEKHATCHICIDIELFECARLMTLSHETPTQGSIVQATS